MLIDDFLRFSLTRPDAIRQNLSDIRNTILSADRFPTVKYQFFTVENNAVHVENNDLLLHIHNNLLFSLYG